MFIFTFCLPALIGALFVYKKDNIKLWKSFIYILIFTTSFTSYMFFFIRGRDISFFSKLFLEYSNLNFTLKVLIFNFVGTSIYIICNFITKKTSEYKKLNITIVILVFLFYLSFTFAIKRFPLKEAGIVVFTLINNPAINFYSFFIEILLNIIIPLLCIITIYIYFYLIRKKIFRCF